MIIRVENRQRFTVVDNGTVEDERLSYRALGLLVYLLSKPDGWNANVSHLMRQHTEGREATRAALVELEKCGYVERRWVRVGTAPTIEYVVHESAETRAAQEPVKPACPETGKAGKPKTRHAQKSGRPGSGKAGNRPVVSTDLQVKTEQAATTESPRRRVARLHWDATSPKPTLRGGFPALMGMCRTLLEAGHTEQAVLDALASTSAYTLDAITFALNAPKRQQQNSKSAMNTAAIDTALGRTGGWLDTQAVEQ